MHPEKFQSYTKRLIDNCSRVIVGKEEVMRQIIVSFLCGGHVLLEDVPGTGKTMLFRAFSKSIGGEFKRIQFTPDLLPSDLTGINFYNQGNGRFEFRPGPLFASMILADEINRATPRTALPIPWPHLSWSWPPRIPLSPTAPSPCRKRRWTGSSCAFPWAT